MSILSAVTLLYYIPFAAIALHLQLNDDYYAYDDSYSDEERDTPVSNDQITLQLRMYRYVITHATQAQYHSATMITWAK